MRSSLRINCGVQLWLFSISSSLRVNVKLVRRPDVNFFEGLFLVAWLSVGGVLAAGKSDCLQDFIVLLHGSEVDRLVQFVGIIFYSEV